MVGDAKQCIYKFRQARPEYFIRMKNEYTRTQYPKRVQLDRNFRSRSAITSWVNFVFRQLMFEDGALETWEIPYEKDEFLQPAASYAPVQTPCAMLHLLLYKKDGDRLGQETRYVADWIKRQLDAGLTVQQGDGTRPAGFGDF
jgi:ATP-dependent helicase/nuclease subunit A